VAPVTPVAAILPRQSITAAAYDQNGKGVHRGSALSVYIAPAGPLADETGWLPAEWREAAVMRIFGRKDPVGGHSVVDHAGRPSGERPGWMQDGSQVALLAGSDDLEVVGESHYQASLWRLAGAQPGAEHVRVVVRLGPVNRAGWQQGAVTRRACARG
jgi:hypothetical protein